MPWLYLTPAKLLNRSGSRLTTQTIPSSRSASLSIEPRAPSLFPPTIIFQEAGWISTRSTTVGIIRGAAARGLFRKLFPPGITGIQVVPEFNILVPLFPAKKHFLAPEDGREIDEPTFEILDLNLAAVELQQHLPKVGIGPNPIIHEP